jgi:hypothetical protein
MEGMSCTVDPDSGEVGEDIDVSEDDETVHDGSGISEGGIVLASNSSGIYLMKGENGWFESMAGEEDLEEQYLAPTIAMKNVKDAQLTDAGFIALRRIGEGCEVVFVEGVTQTDAVSVSSSQCPSGTSITTTANGLQAFLSGANGLFSVTPQGVDKLADVADAVAFNETTQRLLVVNNSTSTGALMGVSGDIFTVVDLPGAVKSAQGFKQADQFALSIQMKNDGAFATVTSDGILSGLTSIPQAAPIELSADGSRVAFVLDTGVHFFSIN